ncbi:MAG: hypothetical protein EBT66_09145 [Bacteroidetes bacterium]|nr:hypothetical protein [Bacteroidota bacterium]
MDIFKRIRKFLYLGMSVLYLSSCTETENIEVKDNQPPNYKGVSTLRIENYVQRMFIDLLGREATDAERISFTNQLKLAELHDSCRQRLASLLMFDTTYRSGDSSYRHAFAQRIYDISKARFLEGASDPSIAQFIGNLDFAITIARLNGDSIGVYLYTDAKNKYFDVLNSRFVFRKRIKDYRNICAVMMNNSIYDGINMNSFNYINAVFDNCLLRKPTQDEFDRSYTIIEKNAPAAIFSRWASNKNEYCDAVVNSDAFHEAQIRWFYYVLLQREATTAEVSALFFSFYQTHQIEKVIQKVITGDEYAQF